MKRLLVSVSLLCAAGVSFSQSIDEGVKHLYYKRTKAAKATFQKIVNNNPNDTKATFWLGEALLAADDVAGAKALYQKALQAAGSDAWLLIGMGHVEIAEGGDINSAKQKFEQAITATKNKKGVENVEVLVAIARVNAAGGSKYGDPVYGAQKAKRAAEIDPKNADAPVFEGVNYLKMGGDKGGDAVQAFTEATVRDPKRADAYFRIGRIYQSQNNKESFDTWYGKALEADGSYPDTYLAYFQYFQDKDVNKAKEYLDKFVANSEQSCITDYFVADYLFRAGKYQESLDKANAMEAGECKGQPRNNVLFAYNYDRLHDSIKAKDALDVFFAKEAADKIQPDDYIFASKLYSKIPGYTDQALGFLNKAAAVDTLAKNRIGYYNDAAALLTKAGKLDAAYEYTVRAVQLKKGPTSEFDYYKLSKLATDALATNPELYPRADSIIKAYVQAFPEKPQGYGLMTKAAKIIDTANATGLSFAAASAAIDFYKKDTAKYKQQLFDAYYTQVGYYNDRLSDYAKAIEILDTILVIAPNEPTTVRYRGMIQKNLDRKNNPTKEPITPKPGVRPKTSGGK